MTVKASKRSESGHVMHERIKAWQQFAAKLQKIVHRLKEDHSLVLCEKGTNHFVQFLGQGAEGLRVETVSNAFLSGRDRLSEIQIESLLNLGWHAPTGTPEEATPEKQPEGSSNYFRQFLKPIDAKEVTALAIATLVDVMRVPHPGFLTYEGQNVDKGGSLVFSELGLKAAEPRDDFADLADRLLRTLREEIGVATLDFDEDGDIPIRYGSVLLFVRVSGETPSVRIHAPILREIRKTRELLERLNELNSRVVRPSFFHLSDCVVAITDFPASPFERQHVVRALREFCTLTDGIDELLQAEFGGLTMFAESMQSTKIH